MRWLKRIFVLKYLYTTEVLVDWNEIYSRPEVCVRGVFYHIVCDEF